MTYIWFALPIKPGRARVFVYVPGGSARAALGPVTLIQSLKLDSVIFLMYILDIC